MQSHFPSPFLMYSLSFTIITSVYPPAFYPYHPRFPISQAQLLSASARDTIVPADLLILNDACKLRLSIAGFIYLLTNYYPWCLALCCIVCVHIKGAQCVCVHVCVSSDCCDKVPRPLLVQPALSVYLQPLTLCGMLTLWPVRHIHMHDCTHPQILSGFIFFSLTKMLKTFTSIFETYHIMQKPTEQLL